MRVDHFSSRSQPGCVAALAGVAGLDWNVRDNNGDYPVTIALEWGLADILQAEWSSRGLREIIIKTL